MILNTLQGLYEIETRHDEMANLSKDTDQILNKSVNKHDHELSKLRHHY